MYGGSSDITHSTLILDQMKLVADKSFKRAFKEFIKKNPQLK